MTFPSGLNLELDALRQKLEAETKRANHYQRRYAELYDLHHGTPCQQVQWEQEKENLEAKVLALREALELSRRYVESDARNKQFPLAIGILQEIEAALTSTPDTAAAIVERIRGEALLSAAEWAERWKVPADPCGAGLRAHNFACDDFAKEMRKRAALNAEQREGE